MNRLFSIFVVTVFLFCNVTYAQSFIYSDPLANFSIVMPEEWRQISQSAISHAVLKIQEETAVSVPDYSAGFQLADKKDFSYPYFLIEFRKQNMPSYEEIERSINSGFEDKWQRISDNYSELLSDVNFEKPFLDRERNAIFSTINGEVSGVGKIKGSVVMFLGREGFVQFSFYSKAEEYEQDLFVFNEIIDSFKFNAGFEYDPVATQGSSIWEGSLEKSIIGGLTGVLMLLLTFAFRKYNQDKLNYLKKSNLEASQDKNFESNSFAAQKEIVTGTEIYKEQLLAEVSQFRDLTGYWWYRMLQVVCITVAILAVIFLLSLIYKEYRPTSTFNPAESKIVCVGGNNKTLPYGDFINKWGELPSPHNLIDRCELRQGYRCEQNPNYHASQKQLTGLEAVVYNIENPKEFCHFEYDYEQIFDSGIERYYRVEKVYDNRGSWKTVILLSSLVILGAILSSLGIKRLFFYIVFGTFKSEKSR